MNKIIVLTLSVFFIQIAVFAQTPANDPHWKLKWRDAFDAFDANKWIISPYTDHYYDSVKNSGYKYHVCIAKNVRVENGNLTIAVNNDTATCPNPAPPPISGACGSCTPGRFYNYTGGWIETKSNNNTQTQFGYIEARMKLPYRERFYLSFWTFLKEGASGNAAEIDIFEIRGKNPVNVLPTNVHTHFNFNEGFQQNVIISDPNFSYTDWHNYAIEWDANRIIWYVDGKSVRTLTNHGVIDPVRIIFSMGIDPYIEILPPLAPFQDLVFIDSIRVSQLQYDCKDEITPITDLSTYNYEVKKSITLGAPTIVPQNSNITLRATDFIELQSGFSVPEGTEMYLDITPCYSARVVQKQD